MYNRILQSKSCLFLFPVSAASSKNMSRATETSAMKKETDIVVTSLPISTGDHSLSSALYNIITEQNEKRMEGKYIAN